MANWLYQMRSDELGKISNEKYLDEIWEGEKARWRTSKITPGKRGIGVGDTIVLVFCKSSLSPGIHGLGIILRYSKDKGTIVFVPIFPSDDLKTNPIWDDEISNMLEKVRGKIPRGTIWLLPDKYFSKIRRKIVRRMNE